jgi:beta-lactam-binding protein with PASTA domain
MFKFITHRPLWINVLTGIALAFLILFLFIFSLRWCTHHNESKTVPSVSGRSLQEARHILDTAGFNVEILDSLYVDTAKPLQVLKQVPEADELVKINRTVYLTINRAVPPIVEMPNLVGYSYRSAEMTIKNANLRVGDTTFKPNFAKNTVLEQLYEGNPIKPGTKIRMGSTISLVLADGLGQQKFPVPNLVGMTYCDARSFLQANGLDFAAVITTEDVTDTCSAYIYKQLPERYDADRHFRYIRPGQLMDIWLQAEKPVFDSLPRLSEPGEPE